MGRVEGSSKLCAFCTKCTAYSIPSWIGSGILHRFYSEFLSNSASISKIIKVNSTKRKKCKKLNSVASKVKDSTGFPPPPENWTVCGQCLPFIQSALESKENVNKVEGQVRKLQLELLKVLQSLVVERDKMIGDLQIIEQIALEKPAEKGGFEDIATILVKGGGQRLDLLKEEEKFVEQFKQKIKTVIQNIKVFGKDTSTKVIKDDDPGDQNWDQPPIKLGRMDNNLDKDNNSSLNLIDECNGASTNSHNSLTRSSISNLSDDQDQDSSNLDNQSKVPSSLPKSVERRDSQLRINLIKRINLGRTIATSKNLPLSLDDPRRSLSIEFSQTGSDSDSKFFIQDTQTQIIVLDEGLQCGSCNFKVDETSSSANQPNKRGNIEDKIFEHILSMHLNLYDCPICGDNSDTYLTWRAHKQTHLKDKIKIAGKGGKITKKKISRRKAKCNKPIKVLR